MEEALNAEQTTCAWCFPNSGTGTHGICQSCANRFMADYAQKKLKREWQKLQSVPSYVEVQAAIFAQEK